MPRARVARPRRERATNVATTPASLRTRAGRRALFATILATRPDASPATQVAYARGATVALVRGYWRARVGKAPLPAVRVLVPEPLPALPPELVLRLEAVGAACADDSLAAAQDQLTSCYPALLPGALRAREGMFYTPPALVRRLLDQVTAAGERWQAPHILDPAAGGGALLAAAAERVLAAMAAEGRSVDEQRAALTTIRGIEQDPFAAWLAWVFLELVAWPTLVASGRRLAPPVAVGDALAATRVVTPVDLVLSNPPYGKTTLAAADRARFQRSLFGHANWYGLFLDAALTWTRRGGRLGFVTPTSFLGGAYFQRLRGLLATEAPPVSLDRVSARSDVFDDVLQETCLLVAERGAAQGHVAVASVSADGTGTPLGAFPLPPDPATPWLLPRTAAEVAVVRAASRWPQRLGTYGYTVSTGPLVWNRHRDQLHDAPGPHRLPLVWAESIAPDGRFLWQATRGHAPYCAVGAHQGHLVTRQPVVLLQRTTAPEQPRRLLAACLPAAFLAAHGGVVIENHVNLVRAQHGVVPPVALPDLAAYLASTLADQLFRAISGSVAVSATELEALPFPPASVLAGLAALSPAAREARLRADLLGPADLVE